MSGEKSTSEPTQEVESIAFAEFLETIPPSQSRPVRAHIAFHSDPGAGRFRFTVVTPEIQLYCPSDSCNGTRFYRSRDENRVYLAGVWNNDYITYQCANCRTQQKTFALAIFIETASNQPKEAQTVHCYKFGENPPYGPSTPARLISLIGPDRELFLKGRRCENQGLGIGAFVYYRRVVEEQKNRIIDEILKVAHVLSAPPDSILALKNAQKETQFSKAVEDIKEAIPQRLLIAGRNPLSLLHSALSMGLHSQSDEKCLELAKDIRLILAEMSELLGQALKDERELKVAVSRLTRQPGGSVGC
jgi:hypothetical protein